MYLKMTAGPMPTGPPIKYIVREDGRLQPKALSGTSLMAKECLEYLEREYFPDLQTAYNGGKEKFTCEKGFINVLSFLIMCKCF